MRISPINFGLNPTVKSSISNEISDFVPTTVRRNSLSDMEFNIIADTIRCQNLKNQMNVRLMNLRKSLNNYMAQSVYTK